MCTTGRLTRAVGSHSSTMYMHPSASNPRTCKSTEYVDYTKNWVSPAEDSVALFQNADMCSLQHIGHLS